MLKPLQLVFYPLLLLSQIITAESCLARTEQEIKATYVYHFINFVQWPSGHGQPPLNICTLDDTPISDHIKTLAEKRRKNMTTIRVTALSSLDKGLQKTLADCAVVYIGRLNADRIGSILTRLSQQTSLTISDAVGFADKGGMIEFVQQGDLIRFNINLKPVEQAKLIISSKLLELAHKVER